MGNKKLTLNNNFKAILLSIKYQDGVQYFISHFNLDSYYQGKK